MALLTFVVLRTSDANHETVVGRRKIGIAIGVLLILTLVQIVMGTQVRESVDEVAGSLKETPREHWINAGLDWIFYVHRSYSIVLLLGHTYLAYTVYQAFGLSSSLTRWSAILLVVVVLEILSGAIMAYFAIPPAAQPVHLALATIAFGLQVFLLLKLYPLNALQLQSKQEHYASY